MELSYTIIANFVVILAGYVFQKTSHSKEMFPGAEKFSIILISRKILLA